MKKILVSGSSGIVGYGILRALRESTEPLHLIGTTIYDDSIAPAFCDQFIQAPATTAEGYIDWLIETIEKNEVDLIIPGIDADLYCWSNHVTQLEQAGAKVVLNNLNLIGICKDKWKFYEHLTKEQNPYVIPSSLSDDFDELMNLFGLPLLLKPRQGFGSKGIVRVYDEATFQLHRKEIGKLLMVQPLIGNDDEEYTTSAFCDGMGGFLAHMTLRRKLSKDGFTEKAEVAEPPGIDHALHSLCKLFKPVGPTNFQFRMNRGELKLLEINPRISSSTSIRSAFGYNESIMTVDYYLRDKIPVQPTILQGHAVRYVEDHIFYE